MVLTPLNATYSAIFESIKDKNLLSAPFPLREDSKDTRDKTLWCAFHDDYGHITENCRSLRARIQRLVERGLLDKYKLDKGVKQTLAITTHNVIHACHARVDCLSRNQRKTENKLKDHFLRDYYSVHQFDFLKGIQVETYEDGPLSFSDKDLLGVHCPHYDAVVITTFIGLWRVQR
ncbi:hypothetical protein FRX31_007519, partial [Thalictrum thalictroides]